MKHVELNPTENILRGLDLAADAVTGTLGPRGRNAFIDDPMVPRITNDGKTIAESIVLEDKLENLGAWLVRNTASQTNDDAGDGTTTTTLLLQQIIHEALKRPENPMEVASSLLEASEGIVEAIKAKSRKVEDIYQVALTSTEHEELAKVIAEVVNKVGEKGTILVQENTISAIDHEIVNGYEANVGFYSPFFVTNPAKMVAEFTNIAMLVSEKRIGSIGDIAPLFEQLKSKNTKSLVIVCEDIDPSILGILIQNKRMGFFDGVVIRANGPLLQDIAATVGATIISDSMGVTFDNLIVEKHLGQAEKVYCTEKKTVFLADFSTAKEHADSLENMAKDNPNKWEAKKMMERVAKLRGGMAVIRVGAPTTLALGYLKDKADDAVHATQAALEEGIVEGGGMCLWRIAQEMESETIGQQILKKSLRSPLRKIIENAGLEYAEIVSELLPGEGYNAKSNSYGNLFEDGVIDPAKVERAAVVNAISNAAKFITTHVSITDVEKDG